MSMDTVIRIGMEVIGFDGQPLGQVERVQDDELMVQGAHFPLTWVDHVADERVYLSDTTVLPDEELRRLADSAHA